MKQVAWFPWFVASLVITCAGCIGRGQETRPEEGSCPPEVVARIDSVDLSTSESSELFSWIAERSTLDCQVDSLCAVAERLDGTSDLQVVGEFCGAVATYARFIEPEGKRKIAEAYRRIPYESSLAMNYFAGLRSTGIDLRDHLEGQVPEDWTFTHPRREAATWHHYLYRASLDEDEAYAALAKKIADTQDGNDVTNLLKSLAELGGEGVRGILEGYLSDTRHADGPDGPGPLISETAKQLLATLPE